MIGDPNPVRPDDAMPYDTLRLAVADGVATITFARPDVRNVLTEAMRANLAAALAEVKAGQGKDIQALVLAGDGPAFYAGGDIARLSASAAEPPAATRARLQGSHALLQRCSTSIFRSSPRCAGRRPAPVPPLPLPATSCWPAPRRALCCPSAASAWYPTGAPCGCYRGCSACSAPRSWC
ncbi:MAG: hypothetical protein FJX53_00765 [Alphaproteobacteria bacterium]|nr:hypothetical protein [Alphaproteobacteria bacterium]